MMRNSLKSWYYSEFAMQVDPILSWLVKMIAVICKQASVALTPNITHSQTRTHTHTQTVCIIDCSFSRYKQKIGLTQFAQSKSNRPSSPDARIIYQKYINTFHIMYTVCIIHVHVFLVRGLFIYVYVYVRAFRCIRKC